MKLGLIGFVFWGGAGRRIGVSLWEKGSCGGFVVLEIGFVLHNNIIIGWQAGLDRRFGKKTERGRQETGDGMRKTDYRWLAVRPSKDMRL